VLKRFHIVITLCIVCFTFAGCAGGEKPAAAGGVDVDLTKLSGVMVYAEVSNIMAYPGNYMGKTVKLDGTYCSSYYEPTDSYYHWVVITDATACCPQGIEFVWNGGHDYPGDYPEEESYVEVTGVFGKYEELGYTYYYLSVDDIKVLY